MGGFGKVDPNGGSAGPSRERAGFRPRFFIGRELLGGDSLQPDGAWFSASDEQAVLEPEDSHHALKVLRLRPGDLCEVVTPSGRVYLGTIVETTDPVRVRPVVRLEGVDAGAAYRTQLGLVQALARPALLDYAIEKGTEVGASFFLLVPASGSGRVAARTLVDRLVRWRRIAREAAKQSRQTAVPPVEVAESVRDALHAMADSGTVAVILQPGAQDDLPHVVRAAIRKGRAREGQFGERPPRFALWIGPEGGWSEAELAQFAAAGAVIARLGRSVLRTETAGPVAIALARLALGDW